MPKLPRSITLSDRAWTALQARFGVRGISAGIERWATGASEPSEEEALYRAMLRRQLRELRSLLSEAELVVIANAINGWLVTPEDIHLLYMEVEDMAVEDTALAGPVDIPALVVKLRAMPECHVHALVWAIRRALGGASLATRYQRLSDALGGPMRGARDN